MGLARQVGLASLVLLASACGDSGPDSQPPRADAPALCAAVNPATVAQLVGAGASEQVYATEDGSAAGCTFAGTDGRTLTVNLARGPRPDGGITALFAGNRAMLESADHRLEDVPGLGDAAYWQPDPGVLHLRAGECYLTAHLGPAQPGARAALGDLTAALVGTVCRPTPAP